MMHNGIPAPEAMLARAGFASGLVRDLVRDVHEAEDIEQEVLLATLCNPTPLKGSPRAWITVVARRLAHRLHRERTRRARREQLAARREATESAADTAARFELHRLLVTLVRRLSEPSRTAILLRYFEDLPPKAIAERLGIPVATVKTRLQRALARLRADLDGEHGGNRAAWCAVALPWAAEAGRPGALAAGGLMGGVAVKAMLAAGVLLVAVSGVALLAARDRPPVRTARTSSAGRRNAPAALTGHGPEAPPDAGLAPRVDLDACDRDLDLHGRVVRRDGSGIGGARLETVTFPWRLVKTGAWEGDCVAVPGREARSATDGSFAIRLAWGEAVALRVSAPGFPSREIAQVTAGERVRIVLDAGVDLALCVQRPDASPCGGERVCVVELGAPYASVFGMEHYGTTDAAGHLTFEDLAPSQAVRVQALTTGGGWTYRFQLPETGTLEKVLALPPGRVIEGRVTDAATRRPVAGAEVRVDGLRWPAVTDADGEYRLAVVGASDGAGQPRKVALAASAPGYAPGRAPVEARVDFALEPGGAASGRVVDGHGEPVAGAQLAAGGDGLGPSEFTTSDEAGRFAFRSLTPGAQHTLLVTSPGYARTQIDFRPDPAFEFGDVTLGEPGVIEGQVLNEDGTPLARVPVERRRSFGPAFGAKEIRFTDDLGRFRFVDQPDGMHTLHVTRADGTVATSLVAIKSSPRRATVTLRFEAPAEYIVRVRDAGGDPLPGVRASVSENGQYAHAVTDTRGEARMRFFGAATWVGLTAPAGYVPVEPRMAEEGVAEYEFVLEKGAPVSGSVLGELPSGRYSVEIRSGARRFTANLVGRSFTAWVPRDVPVDLELRGKVPRQVEGEDRWTQGEAFVRATARAVVPGTCNVVLHASPVPTDRALSVRVVSPSGAPLPGLWVEADPVRVGRPDRVGTAATGTAAFAGLGAVSTRFTVRREEDWRARRWLDPAAAEVMPDGQEVELRLRAAREVQGVLIGFPAGKSVVLFARGKRVSSAVVDEAGRFVLLVPRDEPGPFEVKPVERAPSGIFWMRRGVAFTDLRSPVRIERSQFR